MPAMHISRDIEINASLETVYASISDFKQWPQWSPWLIAEPDCTVTFAEDGNSYSWDGNVVGSGKMSVIHRQENERIQYDLQFLKPWKSQAKVTIELTPTTEGTRVTWSMDSSLPFFMFFMKGMMQALIGMDYERGLLMLKDLLETGEVPVKLEMGSTKVGPFTLLGRRTECDVANLGESMEADIVKLKTWMEENDICPQAAMMSVYHKWALTKGRVGYTIGFPVSGAPSNLAEGMVVEEISELDAATSRLTGPYRHIGSAWAAGIMHGRSGAFKQSRKQKPFEIYENSPEEIPENELITTVHFPVK